MVGAALLAGKCGAALGCGAAMRGAETAGAAALFAGNSSFGGAAGKAASLGAGSSATLRAAADARPSTPRAASCVPSGPRTQATSSGTNNTKDAATTQA